MNEYATDEECNVMLGLNPDGTAKPELKFLPELTKAFNDIYNIIGHDLCNADNPANSDGGGGSISRDDLFDICCDHMCKAGLLDHIYKYWREIPCSTQLQYKIEVFKYEVYET